MSKDVYLKSEPVTCNFIISLKTLKLHTSDNVTDSHIIQMSVPTADFI